MEQQIILSGLTVSQFADLVTSIVRNEISSIETQKPTAKETYLSRKEAAKLLGVSYPTLRAWVLSGKIRGHRIGNSVRFKSSEIDKSLIKIKSI